MWDQKVGKKNEADLGKQLLQQGEKSNIKYISV